MIKCNATGTEKQVRLPPADIVAKLPAPIVVKIRVRESLAVQIVQQNCGKQTG